MKNLSFVIYFVQLSFRYYAITNSGSVCTTAGNKKTVTNSPIRSLSMVSSVNKATQSRAFTHLQTLGKGELNIKQTPSSSIQIGKSTSLTSKNLLSSEKIEPPDAESCPRDCWQAWRNMTYWNYRASRKCYALYTKGWFCRLPPSDYFPSHPPKDQYAAANDSDIMLWDDQTNDCYNADSSSSASFIVSPIKYSKPLLPPPPPPPRTEP